MAVRLTDHTADVGIEADALTEAEALAEAATGLVMVLTGRDGPHGLGPADAELAFTLEAPDHEALLVAFLAELLWHLDRDGMLWTGGGVEVRPAGPGLVLSASGNAVRYDPARHGHGVEVKAVTYHDIASGPAPGGWRLRVTLDI